MPSAGSEGFFHADFIFCTTLTHKNPLTAAKRQYAQTYSLALIKIASTELKLWPYCKIL
jgi:hypothetical protein